MNYLQYNIMPNQSSSYMGSVSMSKVDPYGNCQKDHVRGDSGALISSLSEFDNILSTHSLSFLDQSLT